MRKTDTLSGHPLVRLIADNLDPDRMDVPDAVVEWVEEHRAEAIPVLLGLASDRTLLRKRAPAHGEIPMMAVYLLGSLEEPETVEPLLELICAMPRVHPEIQQWDCIWDTLHNMTEWVTEPTIRFYQRTEDPTRRAIAATLLGDVQDRDPRVFDILVRELATNPCLMAGYLAELQDRRATPFLMQAFDQCAWNHGGDFGEAFPGQPLFDLYDAIIDLSGDISTAQLDKFQRAWQARTPTQPPPALIPRPAGDDSASGLLADMPKARFTVASIEELCEKALHWYGTVRKTSAMLEVRPARLRHFAYTRAEIL